MHEHEKIDTDMDTDTDKDIDKDGHGHGRGQLQKFEFMFIMYEFMFIICRYININKYMSQGSIFQSKTNIYSPLPLLKIIFFPPLATRRFSTTIVAFLP